MSRYDTQLLLVCPADARDAACVDAAALTGRPEDETPDFFSIPCSATGDWPATHWAAVTVARSQAVGALPSLELKYPGAQWSILAEHIGSHDAQIYQHWTGALSAMGMARIAPSVDDTAV